jgi:hypothetical protein
MQRAENIAAKLFTQTLTESPPLQKTITYAIMSNQPYMSKINPTSAIYSPRVRAPMDSVLYYKIS